MEADDPLAAMKQLSSATRRVGIASPEDVLEERRTWPPEEMAKEEHERGPARVKVTLREGARPAEFVVRGLSYREKEAAERIVSEVVPPRKTRMDVRPGMPPTPVDDGFDENDPKYLAEREAAGHRRLLYICLKGVVGLEEKLSGRTITEKLDELAGMNEKLVSYLASEVWHFTYSGRDIEDFFFKAG